jgi:predicted RNA binding protein YcfA (HicA-like mRNA interferase family)
VSGAFPPLTYQDVIAILKKFGFEKRPNKSTAHEQWVAQDPFRKVTVDKHLQPFSQNLISSMAKQAGVTKKEFYRLLAK